jgi:ATP-dependent helicase/nuclease subunit A
MKAAYDINGQSVSAQAFYALACDPARSVAVEACAGAGKTWMLVSRMVRALLEGVPAHEILAITFTKRAAAEMRERLYQWLAEFASADRPTLIQALRDRGIALDEAAAQVSELPQQLAALYQKVLDNGRQVQVRTFHSWFGALLRSAPLALLQQMELPTTYELLEDDAQASALVWRRFYAALVMDAEGRADFEAVVFEYGRAQTEKALQTALDKRTEFALADARGIVAQSVLHFADQYPEFVDLKEPQEFLRDETQRWQTLLDAAKALGQASAPSFSAKGLELETALSGDDWSGVFDALFTDKGTPRKFSEKVAGIARVREAQELVLRVQAAQLQHGAWHYQQRMTRLARVLLREYAALKRERGWVDMNDVERAALTLLGDPVLSGWVQERLDARVRHLLIDEFQDTNPLQWQALRSWLSAYAGAGGSAPSVFIVGDPKQSIYRFRRAEPQVFKAAQAFVRDALGGGLLSCDHTRRNATGVMATVNAVMMDALRVDAYLAYREHSTSSLQSGKVGSLPPIARPVTNQKAPEAQDGEESVAALWRDSLQTALELPEETLRTQEARQAAAWIAAHLRTEGRQPADVMVLSRRRSALLPLQDELRRLGIAAQIGDKSDLIDSCEVQDVLALLDVLVSPQHDLSMARVLKSPIFELDDELLVSLRLTQIQTGQNWFEVLQQSSVMTNDGTDLAQRLLRWKAWLDVLPPHDALQAIYSDGDLLARFAALTPAHQVQTVLANLRTLLSVSLQLGGGRFTTPYGLVRALKAGGVRAPAAVNAQAVRLLTIHGAKGLEADTVLLLDTDAPEHKAETMGVLVDWPGEAAWPAKFVFLASESHPPVCAGSTLAAERVERQREELNALYVALTRARATLVLSSIEPYRRTGRSWWQRLRETESVADISIDVAASSAGSGADADNSLVEIRKLPAAPPGQASALPVTEPDSIESRIGKAMHRMLEWGRISDPHTAAAAREFQLTPPQAMAAAAMAGRILQGDAAWAWDPAVVAWSGNEVELHFEGQLLRMDRLLQRRDNGHWWVLDYKSAGSPQDDPQLRSQLRSYRRALRAIYPGAKVRAAFLTAQGRFIELEEGA